MSAPCNLLRDGAKLALAQAERRAHAAIAAARDDALGDGQGDAIEEHLHACGVMLRVHRDIERHLSPLGDPAAAVARTLDNARREIQWEHDRDRRR